MYLILLTVLCGLAFVPQRAHAAKIPHHETVHEVTHLTDVSSNNVGEDGFLYLIASDEGSAERLTQGDFNVTPEGHFVDIDENKDITDSTEVHEISLGTPDIPKQVLHSVLDEIAFAFEDDPLVRESIKTSLKSGEIPVEVLTPGHKSNDENAILIEVFHLEDEEEEKSEDGLGDIDAVASAEEPITVTTTFPAEKNNDVDFLKLFPLVKTDVEQDEESVEETRKRRNSEQTTIDHSLGSREEIEEVETLLSDKKETERTHETVSKNRVSSTTLAADSGLPMIIPRTAKKLSGFDNNTEGWKPMQVFDFVTRKYAESDEEGQPTTLSPHNYEESSTNENIHNMNINASFFDLTDSVEDTEEDDNPDRSEKRRAELNGESNEEYVATTEVIDSSEDSLLHLPGVDQTRNQQPNENETDTDGSNEQRNDQITDFFRVNEDGQSVKTYFQMRDDLGANKENPHNTEDKLNVATVFSEAKLGHGKRKDITQREKRQLDDSSNLSTLNEEADTVTMLPSTLDLGTLEGISNTKENQEESDTSFEVNDSINEETVSSEVDGSTISNEGKTTTSSFDGDTFTTTLPSESEITTAVEENLNTLDSAPTSGEGTTTYLSGQETMEMTTTVSSADDNLVMMEKLIGNEFSSTESRIGNVGVMDFYDI